MKNRVLVLDDEKNMGLVIAAMLERAGFEVLCYQDPKEALDLIESDDLDAIVTDLHMPGVSGMEVLTIARRFQPQVPVVMITAYGTVESAVSALKNGAFDFITKPFDQTELLRVIEKACRTRRERLKEPDGGSTPTRISDELLFIGQSSKVGALRTWVEKVAPTDSTILISGEDGTGRELLALEVHRRSKRSDRPFIQVNCAVVPPALMESELFGYEKGAFEGAVTARPGRFELTDGGTIFLDEVAALSLEMQGKLFRAIGTANEDQEFERVGGITPIRVNVRVCAATNRDLSAEVKAGRFREDLFYRLNVAPIELPPLRERPEDIEALAMHFVAGFNTRFEKRVKKIDDELMTALRRYRWPGNVRQLENVLERMVLLSDSNTLGLADLPEEIAVREGGGEGNRLGFKERVRRQTQAMERDLIEKALAETDGNVTHTAEKLGLSRKGLQLKMKELGIRRS